MNSKAIRKQLLAAVAMVLVAAVALGSSTYAWFANNNKVTATGLKATAQTGSSALLIANNTGDISDKNFQTSVELSTNAQKLAPVSTIDGTNFFWTKGDNVDGIGDAIAETYVAYEETAFKAAYNNAVGYVQYDLLLKATFSEAKNINLTELGLNYAKNDAETDNQNAFRVAFFVSEAQDGVEAAMRADTTLVSIMNSNKTTTNFTAGEAVNSATTTSAVLKPSAAAKVAESVGVGTTYYRVIVKLWIEGEDKSCTSAVFNPLAGTWALNLAFATDANAVTYYTAGGNQPSGA